MRVRVRVQLRVWGGHDTRRREGEEVRCMRRGQGALAAILLLHTELVVEDEIEDDLIGFFVPVVRVVRVC